MKKSISSMDTDLLETNPVTGRRTGLAEQARRALRPLKAAKIPHAVIGAAALAARGLPRMTKHLDVVVMTDDAFAALDALRNAGFRSVTPVRQSEDPEPMYVLVHQGSEVDVLVTALGANDRESTVVAEATPARRSPRSSTCCSCISIPMHRGISAILLALSPRQMSISIRSSGL